MSKRQSKMLKARTEAEIAQLDAMNTNYAQQGVRFFLDDIYLHFC